MIAPLSVALLLPFMTYGVLASPTLIKRQEPFSAATVVKRQNSIITATYVTDNDEPRYLCNVIIGTQTLNLVLDTGSSDLWVFSSLLPPDDRKDHNYYDSNKSPTYLELNGYTFELYYAAVDVEGLVGTDTVTIGTIPVTAQAIELANKVTGWGVGDGVVGLGFQGGNQVDPDSQSTLFENAKPLLDSPLFAVYFPPRQDGAFNFGTLDQSKYTGNIQYARVVDSAETWDFLSESYKVGNDEFDSGGITAFVDTGSNYLVMQNEQVTTYFAAVQGAEFNEDYGDWIFPCTASLPDLGLLISDNWATIPGSSLLRGAISGDITNCLSFITPDPEDSERNNYGVPFLNQYYSIFDGSVPQFGFATISLPAARH